MGFVVGGIVIGDLLCDMALYTFKDCDIFEKGSQTGEQYY